MRAMSKWTGLVAVLFAFGCGSKLDTKLTDEGIAAADALCACMKVEIDRFLECAKPAKQKLGAVESTMADRGYFNDHNDAAPMRAFKERAELCRNMAMEATQWAARRAEPKPVDPANIDPATLAKISKELDALNLDSKPAKKAAAKPTARRAAAKKTAAPAKQAAPTRGSTQAGSTKTGPAANNEHGPLWAK
jgi:hypothetical protein